MARPQGKIEHFQTRFTAVSGAVAYRPSWQSAVAASVLSVAVLTALFPLRTHALTLGDLHSFFRPKAEASVSSSKSQSVQAMPVLEASMNPNPANGGADIAIVDGEAVVAAGGFAGETVVPSKDAISTYVVREGDTLSQIADMFGVSVNTIKWANDISGPIRPGQRLIILPVSGVRHTVKKGDTLTSIAKAYKGDADEIARYNGITALSVGEVILIPNGQEAFEPAPIKVAAKSASSASAASYSSYYAHPLPGGVKTQGVHGTNGVDIAAPIGTPIVASAAGEVIIANAGGYGQGYGSYVVVKHDNGSQTLYAHMSRVGVGIGETVNKGEVIGYVGTTGRSTGPHLHFEIRGGPRNPF